MLLRFVRALENAATAATDLAVAIHRFVDFFTTADQEDLDGLTERLRNARKNLQANLPPEKEQ